MSKADAQQRVKEWFIKFEMQSWWNKKVEDLSKGMSQKLQFVTTVLHEPKLIILDEPFSGLDPVNANLIKEEIFNLAKKGSTIIFSTHRMEQVEEICDHIVLVNKGKKILDGTVAGVKQEYKENIFVVGSPSDISSGADTQLFNVLKHEGNKMHIKIDPATNTNDVLRHFLDKNVSINQFSEVLPSLNDIFIRLVEGTTTARQFQNV
jgi:ABC-2 type transport system ATP-binding protein